MRLRVKSPHEQIPDSVRDYAEQKFSKLSRRLHDLTDVELTLTREHNPSIANDHVAEAVVHTKGPTLVAKDAATTFEAAIDKLVDKLQRQVSRYRDKRTQEHRRRAAKASEAAAAGVEELVAEPPTGLEEPAA